MATVIKASGPLKLPDGGSFNFDDLGTRANQYLDQMRVQAAQILEKANQDAAAIRKKAEEDGRQAALKAAEKVLSEKVGKQLMTLVPALQQAIGAIGQSRQDWLAHWEKTAVHVAAAMTRQAIRREVVQMPEIKTTLVREALELAAGSSEVRLHLNPADHATLGDQVQVLTAELKRLGKIEVIADPAVTVGGCRVQTRFGVIDQTFEAQLARMEEELT